MLTITIIYYAHLRIILGMSYETQEFGLMMPVAVDPVGFD